MLDQDTLRNRMVAGRYLRGLTQADLSAQFIEYGLGKHDVGRIERGDIAMQKVHRLALQDLLRLPAAWFLDPEVDTLIPADGPPSVDEVVRAVLNELGVQRARDPLLDDLVEGGRREQELLKPALGQHDAQATQAAGGTHDEADATTAEPQSPPARKRASGRQRAQ